MGSDILECISHSKHRSCSMNFCCSHLYTLYGVMVQNVFLTVGNRQMSLKATGVKEQRETGESYFRHSSQGKPFWGDVIWAKSWVKWEKEVFPGQANGSFKGCRFESWQEEPRGCSWLSIQKSGENGSPRMPGTRAWRSLWLWEQC